MNQFAQELALMEKIGHGIDPCSGEQLSTPRDPELDKIRLSYLRKLTALSRKADRQENGSKSDRLCHNKIPDGYMPDEHAEKANRRGKKWDKEEEALLEQLWALGYMAKVIATRLGRTPLGVLARLVTNGKFKSLDEAAEADAKQPVFA